MNPWIISVSVLAGILIIARLRHYDVHEREPWRVMIMVTLVGGAWSVAISGLVYVVMDMAGAGNPRSVPGAFLIVGPVEEGAKLLAMLSCLPLFRKHMDEPADGVIYMACIALGFSLIENVFYAAAATNSGSLLALRLVTATPAHMMFSFPMGLAIYARGFEGARPGLLKRTYVCAALCHGLWDALAFSGFSLIVFLGMLWIGGRVFGAVMSYAASVSPFRRSLADFLDEDPEYARARALSCLHCGETTETASRWRLGRIRVRRCGTCGAYLTSWNGLFHLIRHFGAWYDSLSVLPAGNAGRPGLETVEGGNLADRRRRTASFRLDDLAPVLDDLGERGVAKVEKAWWFPGRIA